MATLFREDGTDRGANHGVSRPHDVDAGNTLADVAVDAFKIVQNGLLPVPPLFLQEKLAILCRRTFRERPIKGPNRAVYVSAKALMHRVYITEGWRVEKDRIPGGFGAAGFRIALEKTAGDPAVAFGPGERALFFGFA